MEAVVAAAQNSSILDMWGPMAKVTPFGSTINIVLIIKLSDSVSELEAHSSIQLAQFKVAHRLAETTRGRVFFTGGNDLDRFVLWDYVQNRREIIA